MSTYQIGAVKQSADTLAVAVRTPDDGTHAWMVATIDRGGHYTSDEEVADWLDVAPVTQRLPVRKVPDEPSVP